MSYWTVVLAPRLYFGHRRARYITVLDSFGCPLSLLAKVCVKPKHFDCRGHFCLQPLVIRFNFLFTSALPKFFSASLVPASLLFCRQQRTTVSRKKRHRLAQGCCYGNVLGIEIAVQVIVVHL